jgi:ketosteroid isomerase-like protein
MSQQSLEERNVRFVLDGYARFNAGERVPELWFFTPDAEFHAAREDPDSAVHRGLDAVRRQYAAWVESYPDLTVEPLEARGSGDKVFLWVRFNGHGGGSGAAVEMELSHVLTMRDGRAACIAEYFDRAEALEAAGLAK